jgi:hypothetical protein
MRCVSMLVNGPPDVEVQPRARATENFERCCQYLPLSLTSQAGDVIDDNPSKYTLYLVVSKKAILSFNPEEKYEAGRVGERNQGTGPSHGHNHSGTRTVVLGLY